MIPEWKTYPRSQGHSTVYLQNVVHSDFIEIGDYTTYDDFEKDPRDFQRNNVLYHYPECNHDKLKIGKFCSIACGAKFIFNAANHALGSLSTYPFPVYFEEWGLPTDVGSIAQAWDDHGDIVVGNDVWNRLRGRHPLRRYDRRRCDNRNARTCHKGRAALHHRRRNSGKADTQAL